MPKTVLVLHCGGDAMRGTEICVIQTVKALTEQGFRVIVCRNQSTMDSALDFIAPAPTLIDMQFPEIMIDGKQSSFPLFSYIKQLSRLTRLIKHFRPSGIYCSGGLPCQLAVPIGRALGIPVLCHFHHPAIKRSYYIWLVKFTNKVIFPSQFTKQHSFQKAAIEGDVIYNGIDLTRFIPASKRDAEWRQKLHIAADAVVIGQIGQLTAHKRPDFLVQAFARLRQQSSTPLHLCLVGKGPLEGSLRALVDSLRLTQFVTITGYVDDALPYYQHVFDINVLVSREEGLGISSIEGAACGLPVVVARSSGLIETIIEGVSGLSFNVDSMDTLNEQLLTLIGSPKLRAALGQEGQRFAAERFSAEAYNRGIAFAVKQLTGDNALSP